MSKFTSLGGGGGGSGDVTGPESSIDENIAIFDGTTGKVIKDGLVGLPQNDGELIIGDTAGNAQTATLTGGTGITVTNGAGSVTIDADNNGDVTAAASLDDFAVVCGDGGAKGVQTVAAVGTSGQVLTSNGAGALPTFEDASSGALEFVSFQTGSGMSSVEFTSLPSLTKFLLIFEKLDPVTGGSYLTLEVSNDNGATWITTGYEAGCLHFPFDGTAGINTNSTTHFSLSGPLRAGGTSHGMGQIVLTSIQQPDQARISGTVSFLNNATNQERFGNIGGRTSLTNLNAVRVLMSSGNINFGRFALYGYKES